MSKFKKNKNLKENISDPSEYKDLIQKNPKLYNWDQFISYNNLQKDDIIKSNYKDLINHYFKNKSIYYEDLMANADDIYLDTIKVLADYKLSHNPIYDDLREKENYCDDNFNFIISFIKRSDVIEHLYKSRILPFNFYENGISYVLGSAIELNQLDSLKIILQYLPSIKKNFELLCELNLYEFARDSTFEIYKFIIGKIKISSLDQISRKELMEGLDDTCINKLDKIKFVKI